MFHPQQKIFDHLESTLAIGLYVEKRKLERRRLTGLLDELTPMKFRITEPVFFLGRLRQPGEEMEAPVGPYRQVVVPGGLKNIPQFVEMPRTVATGIKMSVIDRIKAKALMARDIAPKAIAAFEADLDSLIAEGPKLETDRSAAVSMHKEAFAGIRGEFDGLKSAINILSNGSPDPLHASETSAVGSEGKPA